LLDVEVAQVIRRHAARGEIDDDRGRAALADLGDLPLYRYPHDFLLPRVWDLRNNLTAYDAVYVALAEALDAHARPSSCRGSWSSCADRVDVKAL
jgi:predicted nucleic acid-binding protein